MNKSAEKNLTRRYLIWCYKATKEELDWIDRKFTQLKVDYFILKQLNSSQYRGSVHDVRPLIKEFEEYIAKKEKNAMKVKFVSGKSRKVTSRYQYLEARLIAIEKAIGHFLGKKDLKIIRGLYEAEMTTRILQSREHS